LKDGVILSHPEKPLERHLLETLKIAKDIALGCGYQLSDAEKRSIIMHDIAKAHPAFQRKLKSGRGRFGHAEPSSVLVLKLTRDLLYTEAVRRHHSALQNFSSEVWKFWNEWEWNDEKEQLFASLPWWAGANQVADKLQLDICSWQELLPSDDEWEELLSEVVDTFGIDPNQPIQNDWLRMRRFFSILVAADRLEAAVGETTVFDQPIIDSSLLYNYIKKLKGTKLSEWRDRVRQDVVKNSRVVLDKPNIYTITLPTGAGKTITGLQVAMEAAQRFKASRIIYVLPYVSLVEQNADVASKILNGVREDHHLAYGKEQEAGEEKDEKQKTLEDFISFFRYWREPVIVTTLAKLWEVLYSPRANDSMSFHLLSNAIVLLDEPQSISVNHWRGFGHTLEMLAAQMKCSFILMTATQPEILQGQELVPTPVSFPSVRHVMHWIDGKNVIEDIAARMVDYGALEHNSLFVLNTRKSALLMWMNIKKRGINPLFLSRWLTHIDRNRILKDLKSKEKNKERRCLVSTQVIEAGIDLDFELVFRDLGPLDSIIQVAGRCNRHCGIDLGNVYITELTNKKKSYAAQVYDSVLLQQTRLLLQEKQEWDESSSTEIISAYYAGLTKAIDSSPLWENISKGNWGEYISLFNNYDRNEAMLIIDYGGDIVQALEMLQEPLNNNSDKMLQVKKRKEIFQRLSQCSISVPTKYLNEWYEHCGALIWDDEEKMIEQVGKDMWLVSQQGIGTIYRLDIGFVPLEIADLLLEIVTDT